MIVLLPEPSGTDDDIVFAQPDDRVLDSTEAVNAEREQFHQ